MQFKYFGKIEDLKLLVMSVMLSGDWEPQGDKWIFHSYGGGILNWWPSTGTVQFQGKEPGKSELQQALRGELIVTDNCRPVRPTGGSTSTHVATDNGFSKPPHGQFKAVTLKASLAPLLRDLADVFANQGLVLMMVDGVPRIVKEYEYGHSVELAAETKSPVHFNRY